jgi:hypothetical protein
VLDALRHIRMYANESKPTAFCSVRSLARDLGYESLTADILEACADAGFNYCLDHSIKAPGTSVDGRKHGYPPQDVCWWTAEQLVSRLDCVSYKVYCPTVQL